MIMKYLFVIILASLSMLGTYGQKEMPFSELQEKWEKYRQCTIDPLILRKNHFHDTISVEEMRKRSSSTRAIASAGRNSVKEWTQCME